MTSAASHPRAVAPISAPPAPLEEAGWHLGSAIRARWSPTRLNRKSYEHGRGEGPRRSERSAQLSHTISALVSHLRAPPGAIVLQATISIRAELLGLTSNIVQLFALLALSCSLLLCVVVQYVLCCITHAPVAMSILISTFWLLGLMWGE